jgi:hypothetical protein
MDEIIRLLLNMGKSKEEIAELIGKDVPKGGIDAVSKNILKPLTRKAVGDFPLIGSKITDPTSVKNFDFKSISESIADQEANWKKTFDFLREGNYNLSSLQKQNLNHNLGILQRSKNAAKDLQKTINEQKSAPSNVYDLEKNLLDPNKPIMGGTQEGVKVKKMTDLEEAIDNASPGFAGDRKYDAQLVADDLAEKRFGKEFYDLDQKQQMDLYGEALDGLSKPKFRLNVETFKKDFNVSDEEVEKILALSPEEQQKILQDYIDKDFKQQIELMDFEPPEGSKGNAQGGLI